MGREVHGLPVRGKPEDSETTTHQGSIKVPMTLKVEELEEGIAPDSVNGVPGETNRNPDTTKCRTATSRSRAIARGFTRKLSVKTGSTFPSRSGDESVSPCKGQAGLGVRWHPRRDTNKSIPRTVSEKDFLLQYANRMLTIHKK